MPVRETERPPRNLGDTALAQSLALAVHQTGPIATLLAATIRPGSSPAQLFEPLVIDSEMMSDLVDDDPAHLFDYFLRR